MYNYSQNEFYFCIKFRFFFLSYILFLARNFCLFVSLFSLLALILLSWPKWLALLRLLVMKR